MRLFERAMPSMSATEREALEAGTVTFEGEFFSGSPNWKRFLSQPPVRLSDEEKTFLDGPVEELCQKLDDWKITAIEKRVSDDIMAFLKKHGFFGLIIPKHYGGKEFSAWAHASTLMKVNSRSTAAAITIAVPNSLGPAELLVKYGTEEQKNYYLPRLARGEEIPCFALTSPHAGSDAASILDNGVICYGEYEGKKTLGIRLNWDKRYITLAPVATLIGLAFRLHDPDHLVGDIEDIGITCALVPAHLDGITIGRRHHPMHVNFQNGPTQGRDVFVPLDAIIGGRAMAGQGWRMLMECLAVGRGITLPSTASATTMMAALTSGAYARVRKQFNLPIGRFEGVEEALARIGANAYMNLAMLRANTAAIDAGEKPSLASAILKYHSTERARRAVNDAMDIHGGKGICLGPKNYLSAMYFGLPVSITVEGANILTRSLIIFGQGAMRCHPYVLKEMKACHDKDLAAFDKAFFGHALHIVKNATRAFVMAFVPTQNNMQHLTRFSAAFAFASDLAMASMGSKLKRHERISARLGDILSSLYCASAALKRFHDDGSHTEDLSLRDYAVDQELHNIQEAFIGIIHNLPNRFAAWILRLVAFPLGYHFKPPSDRLAHQVAQTMMTPSPTRERLTEGTYQKNVPPNPIGYLEEALARAISSEKAEDSQMQRVIAVDDFSPND